MGIDKSLWDRYPSVIINGSRYHYGQVKKHGEYLVAHERIAKDCWAFKEKEDLQAFLVNLPESVDRNLRFKLHPDWRDVTPEQRTAYLEQDKLLFRKMAAERISNGTAQSFNMDFEGEHGPHEPQRIESRSKQSPIERVERQIADFKTAEAVNAQRAGYPIEPGAWPLGYSETLKLRTLEGEMDWTGVAATDKEAVLAREIDFAKITPKQFGFVYEDIANDKLEPADPAVAQALFDRSRTETGTRQIRDTTRNLVEAVMLDVWPRNAAIVDFGIRSQQHYEALYDPLRHGDFTPEQMDAALGNGRKLTELVNAAPHNLRKGIVFHTDWDDLLPELENHGHEGKQAGLPSPADLAEGEEGKSQQQDRGQTQSQKPGAKL
jgi:hypothetical protein